MFFCLQPKQALLADINHELINLYTVMRDFPARLASLMADHQSKHSVAHYYAVRSAVPNGKIARAARTLYLNRTCWNGLYRVNLKGQFNVPIGTKTKVVMDGEDFHHISSVLAHATICCQDFEDTIDTAARGDFLFVDPPYTVKHNLNGFIKYNEHIFGWSDQIRLRNSLRAAADRGAFIVVTNADHDSVGQLYSGFDYVQLERASVLAGEARRRGRTSEALFLANFNGEPRTGS